MVLKDYLKILKKKSDRSEYQNAVYELLKEEEKWYDEFNSRQICLLLKSLECTQVKDKSADYILSLFNKYDSKSKEAGAIEYAGVLHKWAEWLIVGNDRENAYKKCCDYLYFICKGNKKTEDIVLYSFRKANDYVINDIKNHQLSFQTPSQFNDPLDTLLFNWIDRRIKKSDNDNTREFYYLLKRAAEHFRVRCFVKPPKTSEDKKGLLDIERIHPLMWAHYADSHKGMCIQYRFRASFFSENDATTSFKRVEEEIYTSDVPDLDSGITISNALFTKHKQWDYEDEVRILDLDYDEVNGLKIEELNNDAIIESIYFGYNCSDETKNKVFNVIRNKPIKTYQMVIDDANLHQLKAERIS